MKTGRERHKPIRKPNTICKRLAIGDPADGYFAAKLIRETGGWAEDVTDEEIVEGMLLLARTEGIFAETAGGTTLAVARKLIEQGRIPRDEEIVLCITGNGLKTQDAVFDAIERAGDDQAVAGRVRGAVAGQRRAGAGVDIRCEAESSRPRRDTCESVGLADSARRYAGGFICRSRSRSRRRCGEQAGGKAEVEVGRRDRAARRSPTWSGSIPALGPKLFDNGQLRPFINVFVNDEDIRYLDDLDTRVTDGVDRGADPRRGRRLNHGRRATTRRSARRRRGLPADPGGARRPPAAARGAARLRLPRRVGRRRWSTRRPPRRR